MRFRVARRGRDDSAVPDQLTLIEPLSPDNAKQVRTFDFRTINQDGRHMWTVNGQLFDPSASVAQPRFGTVERWRFSSDFHHPIHLHLVHFQVLSRNGRPPQPSDGGWKDTVDVRPYEVVEVLAHFDGFRGRYMMHCHNLEHEDMAMMAKLDVV
jgi:spore coat protein A